ncbi:hypothetical protein AruPA_19145 [Acidiphilium sp. PA]|nr:hypothetical protein [Acidiphilium sp. PA]MCW8309153.1 hypothetical protein [Acidiphilium sp. PA]
MLVTDKQRVTMLANGRDSALSAPREQPKQRTGSPIWIGQC